MTTAEGGDGQTTPNDMGCLILMMVLVVTIVAALGAAAWLPQQEEHPALREAKQMVATDRGEYVVLALSGNYAIAEGKKSKKRIEFAIRPHYPVSGETWKVEAVPGGGHDRGSVVGYRAVKRVPDRMSVEK